MFAAIENMSSPVKTIYAGVLALLLLVLLPASGCDSGPKEDNARINARGVDGVEFGETPEEVLEKLGPYNAYGILEGLSGGWQYYEWEEGPNAGLQVNFSEVFVEDEQGNITLQLGIADVFTMSSLYQGKTRKGIGVGSTKEEVIQAYGTPVFSADFPPTNHNYFYCLQDKDLELLIEDEKVIGIVLGYHEPLGEGALQFCNE